MTQVVEILQKLGLIFFLLKTWANFDQHGLTLIQAWLSKYMHYNAWDEIIFLFPNFNCCTIEIWEWISNFIPHFTGHMIIYTCWD